MSNTSAAGVVDLTFMDISKESDLVQCVTEYMENSGGGSPKKKKSLKAIRLGNNCISTVQYFSVAFTPLLDTSNIMWLDLSFNQLEKIDESLSQLFPNLTTLYLHANQISKLSTIKKLISFTQLRSLTLYGNPVEENKHYRNLVLYCFPNLQQLDFCVITAGQRDKMVCWSQVYRKSLNPDEDYN
mmetsp:Transcript_25442/g.37505  ORF Transcript_25442/g.37505 Transcript_25442/m.37505 type:complete len:185 (+) Transcript_25442:78-632(+)